MKNKKILVISPEPWGINFVSKHHYALELSKENTVYFLNPPSSPRGSRMDITVTEENEKLFLVSYRNLIPRLNQIPFLLQNRMYRIQAIKIQDYLEIAEFDLIWSFDPYRFYDQKVWKAEKRLYHCVDFHFNAKHEGIIIKSSDLTVVISEIMNDHFQNIPTRFSPIGHGFDPNYTLEEVEVPGSKKLKAFYIGNISGLLAFRRLIQLAQAHPEIDFILIGPHQFKDNKNPFSSIENIYLTGEINAELIPSYLKYSSINLLLLKDRKGVPNSNSHKLMAYFDSGKVTLSDHLIDYENADNSLILLAKDAANFSKQFNEVISNIESHNSTEKQKIRRQFASNNTYSEKLKKISNLLYFENS